MNVSADAEMYSVVTIFDKPAIFTCLRLDRKTVPENMYCYDVREADHGGWAGEVKSHILVNHMGTIILKEPIGPRTIDGYQYDVLNGIPLGESDFGFSPYGDISLSDFIKTPDDEFLLFELQDRNQPEITL